MEDRRKTPLEIPKKEFRSIGYELIDAISDFIETIDERAGHNG